MPWSLFLDFFALTSCIFSSLLLILCRKIFCRNYVWQTTRYFLSTRYVLSYLITSLSITKGQCWLNASTQKQNQQGVKSMSSSLNLRHKHKTSTTWHKQQKTMAKLTTRSTINEVEMHWTAAAAVHSKTTATCFTQPGGSHVNKWAVQQKDNHTNNNLQNHKHQTTCTAQQHKIQCHWKSPHSQEKKTQYHNELQLQKTKLLSAYHS